MAKTRAQYLIAAGSTHGATVPFTINSGAGVTVSVKLWLSTKQNPTGPNDAPLKNFVDQTGIVVTGVSQNVVFPPELMPATLPSGVIYLCAQVIYQGQPVLFGTDTGTTLAGTFGNLGPILWN
jgi:hypothetical protein